MKNDRDRLTIRIFLAVVVGALIIGGLTYFLDKKGNSQTDEGEDEAQSSSPKPAEEGIVDGSGTKNCENIPELPNNALKLATKIIDGDTFLIEGGYSVRILGIDADERGYPCYEEAKKKLEELILNKEVKLEKGSEDLDQYCRYLRYVFSPASAPASAGKDAQNISLELVKEGMAIARSSPEDIKYREIITQAEKNAKENKIGCKWSATTPALVDNPASKQIIFQWDKLTQELTGLIVVNACQAGNYYEKEMIVEGKIVDTNRSKTNTVFLNLEKPYPNQCFNSVIFSSAQYRFVQSPENYYLNKTVRIKGEIKKYQGKPEIILNDPLQIEIGK